MANIKGMVVKLHTKAERRAGTNDHIYVGVFGKGGGSEFPLDDRNVNDFEAGQNVKYWFGDVWDGTVLSGSRSPFAAHGWNDPKHRYIDLESVDYVYLRKHGERSRGDDDEWKMDAVEVTLYGASPVQRVFYKKEDIWLATENGLTVWLREKQIKGDGLPSRDPRDETVK